MKIRHLATGIAAWLMLFVVGHATAYKATLFSDVDTLIKRAKDVVVAKCADEKPNPPMPGEGLEVTKVDVLTVLQGERKAGELKVVTGRNLQPGQRYLLTNYGGSVQGADFIALGEMCVVAVPDDFDLASLTGKPAKEAFERIAAARLYQVERELAPLEAEQEKLKEAIKDRTDDRFDSPVVKVGEVHETTAKGTGMERYLEIGGKKLEWSEQSLRDQTGYVYFRAPSQAGYLWEFASTTNKELKDFEGSGLDARFSGWHSPGSSSDTSRVVKVGEILLARLPDEPGTVYAIKFESQHADERVTVTFAVIVAVPDKRR